MISKQIKPLSLLQKLIVPPITQWDPSIKIIYKGYEPHYQWFQKQASNISHKSTIYCIDKTAIDVALQMAKLRTKTVSYISTRNYQTVTVVAKKSSIFFDKLNLKNSFQQDQNQKEYKQITDQISEIALDILANHKFKIQKAFLDVHPLIAYEKMCGYLMVKPQQKITKIYRENKSTTKKLFKSFSTVNFLSNIRNNFLLTQEAYKLKHMKRRLEHPNKPNEETIRYYKEQWQKITMFDTFTNANCTFGQQSKRKWIFQQNLGEYISLQDVLNNKYRSHFYAQWF